MLERAADVKKQFASLLRTKARDRKLSGAAIASRIGGQTRTVNKWLAGENEPSLSDITKLCRLLNINPGTALGLPAIDDEADFEMIEALDVRAAAGAGALVDDERGKHNLAFRAEWLRQVTNAPRDKLKVIEADSDSMEPFIHDGDHMLVDTTQVDPRRDGIYVIEWSGWLNVKRVTANPANQTISIDSDNPAYSPYHNIDPADVRVIGRVIWVGRRT